MDGKEFRRQRFLLLGTVARSNRLEKQTGKLNFPRAREGSIPAILLASARRYFSIFLFLSLCPCITRDLLKAVPLFVRRDRLSERFRGYISRGLVAISRETWKSRSNFMKVPGFSLSLSRSEASRRVASVLGVALDKRRRANWVLISFYLIHETFYGDLVSSLTRRKSLCVTYVILKLVCAI